MKYTGYLYLSTLDKLKHKLKIGLWLNLNTGGGIFWQQNQ